jgi:hypothetical protein
MKVIIMSSEEELIITTNEEYPLPPLPKLPTLTDEIKEIQPEIVNETKQKLLTELENVTDIIPEVENTPQAVSFMSIWADIDNRSLIIHGLCDIILFYLSFRYVSSSFHKTKQQIQMCKQSIQDLKKQYGFIEE